MAPPPSLQHLPGPPRLATKASMSRMVGIETDRGPRAGGEPEALVQRHGTVMPGADRDAVKVQQRSQVLRVSSSDGEGQHAALFGGRADQAQAGQLVQRAGRIGEQLASCAAIASSPSPST